MEKNRVLLIEDEFMIQYLWEDVCALLSFPITGRAETANIALQLVEEGNFDIAVLDVKLGEEVTTLVAKRLKELRKKVIVSTGSYEGSLGPVYQGFEVLSKPFSTTAMITMLHKLAK